jgi:hypothetical protein
MKKIIYAYCSNTKAFQNNKVLSAAYCKQFPGLSWISDFIALVKDKGHSVITGDVCLKKIINKEIKASDVIVIADLDSQHAKSLVSMGSKLGIVLCYESPLFAETFYENVVSFCADYQAGILFSGIIEDSLSNKHNYYPNHYPSFSNDEIPADIISWEERNELVMVVSNKYYRNPFHLKSILNPKSFEAWVRGKFKISSCSIKRYAINNQLHDKRLEAIDYFCKKSLLDIYGPNWDNLNNLPLRWRTILKDNIKKLSPMPCIDKKRTISHYKFSICIENTIYPGYLTEKIIDSLVAGVIPIYLGDPNVKKIIPHDIFIDIRDYNSWDDLYFKIKSIGENEGENMIKSARQFLRSELGQSFTYYNHAKKIFDLISQ